MVATIILRTAIRGAANACHRVRIPNVRRSRCLSSVPAPLPESELSTQMLDLQVAAKIEGAESQIVTVDLRKGEKLRAESGAMIFMTEGIEMDTNLGQGGAFSRFMTGQNVFLTDFVYNGDDKGTVALGTDFPSKILRLSLDELPEQALVCQRGAYLASNPTVNIEMEFTKSMTAGFFGGQGFILQKLSGKGDVLVKGGGTIVVKELELGETIRVTSGSIVAFERTVEYDVQMMPGIKNAMFGGEGLFVTALTGPGRIWLQGMPPDRMISEIAQRVPPGGPGLGIPIPVGVGGGGGTSDVGDEGAADAVATTDAVIEGDRAATVASSGVEDPNSPSALFGDAAPSDAKMDDATVATQDQSFSSSSTTPGADDSFSASSTETTFEDSGFSSTTFDEQSSNTFAETSFQDDSFSSDAADGELFSDATNVSEGLGDAVSEEGGSSVLGMLWDILTGDE